MNPPTKKAHAVIRNKIQEYCKANGITERQFMGLCMGSEVSTESGKQIAFDTARRIWNGETGINIKTAGLFAKVLGAESISDLFDID